MSGDRLRQLAVTVSALLCCYGTLVGVGVLGTEVSDAAGGVLSDQATLVAPAGPAFSLWSVIYLGLAGYVLWQWLPARAHDDRARATGWWAAASMLLNAGWLLVVQQGWVWGSVAVIGLLAVVLKVLVGRLSALPGRHPAERVLLDGTFGLYLGWVAVATCANVAAALVASGLPATGTGAVAATVAVLLLVLALGAWYAVRWGGRLAVAAAMVWGLGWIGYGRLAEEPASTAVAVTAFAVAAGVLAVTLAVRARRPVGARAA